MISRGIYIVNLDNNQRQPIMMVPREVRADPESNLKMIPSMGRNNPFYHYTGSEDTVEFDISWYATEDDRQDVLKACRVLESWSKSDGDDSGLPDIYISWGKLFAQCTFKLASAKYVMNLFDRPHSMLPTLATQKLIFKRITEGNLTHAQIQMVSEYGSTEGLFNETNGRGGLIA